MPRVPIALGPEASDTEAGRAFFQDRLGQYTVNTSSVFPWTPASQDTEPLGNPGRFKLLFSGRVD